MQRTPLPAPGFSCVRVATPVAEVAGLPRVQGQGLSQPSLRGGAVGVVSLSFRAASWCRDPPWQQPLL